MRQDKVIWFAIVVSTCIYAVLLYTMYPHPPGPFEESVKRQITLVLYGLAIATFVAALVIPNVLRSVGRVKMILTMALFEACVIYGLLAAFLARDWRIFVPTWIVGLLGMWRTYPSSDSGAAATV